MLIGEIKVFGRIFIIDIKEEIFDLFVVGGIELNELW